MKPRQYARLLRAMEQLDSCRSLVDMLGSEELAKQPEHETIHLRMDLIAMLQNDLDMLNRRILELV